MPELLEESVAAVKALLRDAPGEVVNIEDLSIADRTRLLVMSCANIISHCFWVMANHDRTKAVDGLECLFTDMKRNIGELK